MRIKCRYFKQIKEKKLGVANLLSKVCETALVLRDTGILTNLSFHAIYSSTGMLNSSYTGKYRYAA